MATARGGVLSLALLLAALASSAAAACGGAGIDKALSCGVAREDEAAEAEMEGQLSGVALVQRAFWYRHREVKNQKDLEVPVASTKNVSLAPPVVVDEGLVGSSSAKIVTLCRENLEEFLDDVPPLSIWARSEIEVFRRFELAGPDLPKCQGARSGISTAPSPAISLSARAFATQVLDPTSAPTSAWETKLTTDVERKNRLAIFLVGGWGVIVIGLLIWSVAAILVVRRKKEGEIPDGKLRLADEDAAVAKGFISWISLSWVDGLVGRYGKCFYATIDGRDIMENDQNSVHEHSSRFRKAWREEVEKKGIANASLIWALQRTIGAKSCFFIVLAVILEMSMGMLGMVMAMDVFLKFLERMSDFQLAHPEEPVSLLEPTIYALVLLFGVPMFYRTATIMLSLLDGYYCNACAAGLASVVYEKAMLMPVGTSPQAETESSDPESSQQPNVVQILNVDIIECWNSLLRTVVNTAVVPFMIILLFTLLVLKIQLAGFLGCLYLVPCVGTMVGLQICSFMVWKRYQVFQDRRLKCLRETMIHIRTIKALAWEKLSFQRLQTARDCELLCSQKNTCLFGGILAVGHTMPWFTLLLALYCVKKIDGNIPAHEIIVIQRLMASLLQALGTLLMGFHKLVAVPNSFRRIKKFLEQGERPKDITRCPSSSPNAPALTIRGNFTFVEGSEPVLQDLDIAIPKGELVAVIGEVASGKTALLQAMIGELFPVGEFSLEGPSPGNGLLAYCGQVPWIFEGTLHENVVMNQNLDNERYYRALFAAGLTQDLEILPGGDQVTIGTFGVRLSGGQRARVALARAAYMERAEVVVMDDPFASVDVPTAQHIFNELVLGAALRDRTRLVATQPDSNRLQHFDRVLLVEGGRVVAAGPPAEVMACPNFARLQSSAPRGPHQTAQERVRGDNAGAARGAENTALVCNRRAADQASSLRDAEIQDHASTETLLWWVKAAGYKNSMMFCFTLFLGRLLFLGESLTLAKWIDAKVLGPVDDIAFIRLCALVVIVCSFTTMCTFYASSRMSVSSASSLHSTCLKTLLRAPVDKFFDKQPIGRLINRLSGDMRQVDDSISFIILKIVEFFIGVGVMQFFILSVVPTKVAFCAVPLYLVLGFFFWVYRGTTIPLVFHSKFALSKVQDLQSCVLSSCVSIRSNGMFDDFMRRHRGCTGSFMRCNYLVQFVVKAWVQSRVFLSFSILVGLFTVGGLWGGMPMGLLGTVVTVSFAQLTEFETVSVTFANLLNTLNALERLTSYFKVPQESAPEIPGDPCIRRRVLLERADLACLELKRGQEALACVSEGVVQGASPFVVSTQGGDMPILRATADGTALEVVPGRSLADLAPGCEALREASDRYLVVAVNSAARSAELMAEELCSPPASVWLDLWDCQFAMGVRVRFEQLTAGYGNDVNVLHAIDVDVPGRCKMGFAGRTGCGKSTTLLCVLRVLEPRGGRIMLGDNDTTGLGLAALRATVGLVPQDPTIFEGSWRYNVDPFGEFPTGRVWEVLQCVRLLPYVRGLTNGIDSEVTQDGANMSFGQKQLLSLARMVIRQPPVLLLDECTSALDPSTQESVQKTLLNDFPLSTVLAVAHRVETLLDFDRVVVLDAGKVAETGTVQEVLSIPNGIFAGMANGGRRGTASADEEAKRSLEC